MMMTMMMLLFLMIMFIFMIINNYNNKNQAEKKNDDSMVECLDNKGLIDASPCTSLFRQESTLMNNQRDESG